MLYVLKKEQVEHARLRALAQAIISKDKGKEVKQITEDAAA